MLDIPGKSQKDADTTTANIQHGKVPDILMKISHTLHFLATVVFFCIILTIITPTKRPHSARDLSATTASASASVPTEQERFRHALPRHIEYHGELREGDTMTSSLGRLDIPDTTRQQLINQLGDSLDFRRLQPGNRYTLVLDRHDRLVSCTFEAGPLDITSLTRTDAGFLAEKMAVPVECRTVRLSGTINNSLFGAFAKKQVDTTLTYSFADIFASRIDFNTETRQGDRFSLIFEKYYKEGKFIGYGHILMARYEQTDGTVHEGFWHQGKSGHGSFYDRDGRDLGAAFIRSPVPVGRVTSTFTLRRMHPILGVVRPHLGIDLAAPVGTPIMAVGDGKVVSIGNQGGFGKQIVIAHPNGCRTYYGHLSRFQKGLRAGSRVQQKEIIGYVGSTGMSTGPHLDYRLTENGAFTNPFALKFKPKSCIPKAAMASYHAETTNLITLLDKKSNSRILLVRQMVVEPGQELVLL